MELNEQHTAVSIVKFFKFSEEQRLVLRDFYAKNQYPNKQEIENLSNQFGCTKKQINGWFTNTRQVMRRRNDKKSEDSNNFDDEHLESSSEECEVIDAKQENFKEVMPEDQAESINEAPKNVMVSRNLKKSAISKSDPNLQPVRFDSFGNERPKKSVLVDSAMPKVGASLFPFNIFFIF